jgi:hypothetical protein
MSEGGGCQHGALESSDWLIRRVADAARCIGIERLALSPRFRGAYPDR